jgi:hypothetical protein
VTPSLSAAELLALPVRHRGITLGRPSDLLLERRPFRAVGLDVACRDGALRFLPLPALFVRDGEIDLESPFFLLADAESAFYRRRARPFAELRGSAVLRGERDLGRLVDLRLAPDGSVTVLEAEGEGGRIEIAPDGELTVGGRPLRAA